MMRLILLAMMAIVLVISAEAADYSYSINASKDLPFNTSITEQIIGADNSTFVIIQSANFTFPNISLISGVSNFSLRIDITIPANYSSFGNNSINESLFVFVNGTAPNGTSQTTNITFNLFIFNGSLQPLPLTDYIQLDFNTFQFTFCNYSLPVTRQINLTVTSNEGEFISTLCNTPYLQCEDINLSNLTYKTTTINITLPKSTPVGTNNATAQFNIVNTSFNNVSFKFVIENCAQPLPTIPNNILEMCKNTSDLGAQLACAEALRNHYDLLRRLLIEANTTQYVNITQEVNVTQLQFVVPLNNSIGQNLIDTHNLSVQIKDMLVQVRELQSQLTARENELLSEKERTASLYADYPNEVNKATKDAWLAYFNITNENKNIKSNSIAKEEVYKYLKWTGVGVLLLLLFLWHKATELPV